MGASLLVGTKDQMGAFLAMCSSKKARAHGALLPMGVNSYTSHTGNREGYE